LEDLVAQRKLIIKAPFTLIRELESSPFKGIPEWLTVEADADTLCMVGYSEVGARLGNGKVFEAHKGNSTKIKDSIIVDYAVNNADIFVSEDKRARNKLSRLETKIIVFNFNDFQLFLNQI